MHLFIPLLFACLHSAPRVSIVDNHGDIKFEVLTQVIDDQIGEDLKSCYAEARIQHPDRVPERLKVIFDIPAGKSPGRARNAHLRYYYTQEVAEMRTMAGVEANHELVPDDFNDCVEQAFDSMRFAPTTPDTFGEAIWHHLDAPN